ncbi:MAG: hypothetical protein KGS60_17265 [Verrucomicrobia bacterium]|nr:hypothetical protein [Verrucomicrobiota bacterium]
MLSKSFPDSSDSLPQAPVTASPAKQAPGPLSDDGARFAMVLVLGVVGFLMVAAGLADWLHGLG